MSDTPSETSLPATLAPAITPAQRTQIINMVRRAARAEIMPRFRRLSDSDIRTKSRQMIWLQMRIPKPRP